MARNKEKQLVGLNRLILQKQREEQLERNPRRPRLNAINDADDLKKWLPSIKKEIDYYLMQLEVPCYPERIINQFHEKIFQLNGEYQAFVRKLREFNPGTKIVPWTERCYSTPSIIHKRRLSPDSGEVCGNDTKGKISKCDLSLHIDNPSNFIPIKTPILDQELYKPRIDDSNCAMDKTITTKTMDKPLSFKFEFRNKIQSNLEKERDKSLKHTSNLIVTTCEANSDVKSQTPSTSGEICNYNLLGLDYNSSGSDG